MYQEIIDTHSHFNHGVTDDIAVDELYLADLAHLEKVSRAAGICKVFASSFAAINSYARIVEENEFLFDLAQGIDWLYQWLVVDPRNEKTIEQVRKMLHRGKCIGVELHPYCHQYSLEEYADIIFPILSEYGAVAQIRAEKPADYIIPIANRYSDVTFIMSHLIDTEHIDAIEFAKHGNVYADISGTKHGPDYGYRSGGVSLKNNAIEYAVSRVGSERILFGTNTHSPAAQRGRIEYAMISDGDKENIFANNAKRLFGARI